MQPPITVGTVLQNRYCIIQTLGQGGFGRTYLAEDQRRFNEHCAIKELIPTTNEVSVWEKAKELFQREAEVLYQIEHPQIPKFRERFEEGQRLFLVQDYVPGKTYRTLLDERKIRQGVFTESEVLDLINSLLPVLDYIHNRRIVHRDISPDNIILRISDGKPVLIDFGVVKEIVTRALSPDGTMHATTVGKVGYSPSEQMQTGRAYPNSDLYSLAVTAVVLLTGLEPNEIFDDNQLIWTWQKYAKVNPQFAQVLNRMLNYRPSDRYQSAKQVADALSGIGQLRNAPNALPPKELSQMQTIAVGRPNVVQAPPPPANVPDPVIPDPNKSVLDNPWAIGAIGAMVIVIAGFTSWTVVSTLRSNQSKQTQQPISAPQTFPSPVIESTTTPTSPSNSEESSIQSLDFAPDGTATNEGTITGNQAIQYSFDGQQGQKVIVSQEQAGTLFTILGPDGQIVDNKANRTKFYEGILPTSGKYTIELSPIRGLTQSEYSLSVKLTDAASPTPSTEPIQTPLITEPSQTQPTTEPPSQSTPQPNQPTLPTDTTKPKPPIDTTKPQPPTDTTKPKPPIDTTKPKPPTDTTKPQQPTDTTKPQQPTEVVPSPSPEEPTSTPSPNGEQNSTPTNGTPNSNGSSNGSSSGNTSP
ncbi:MAG: protein kinase [Scytonematopsis contorta HA4267-MV1]|jgi:serine/threonine protein kinase|nr:protein kinase [Scytonematopsis contorta HA4267-MV1]